MHYFLIQCQGINQRLLLSGHVFATSYSDASLFNPVGSVNERSRRRVDDSHFAVDATQPGFCQGLNFSQTTKRRQNRGDSDYLFIKPDDDWFDPRTHELF